MQASATTRGICHLSFADYKNNTLPLIDHIKKWLIELEQNSVSKL